MSKKKVVVAAVPYSDNLGDGVISDNITGAILRNYDVDVEVCDISYREKVSVLKSKEDKLSIFMKLPLLVRQLVVVSFFSLKYFRQGRSYYDGKLNSVKCIFIGGGQLICDVDANFPLKLFFLVKEAEKRGIPVSIISVGVANKWSWLGRKLMSRVVCSPMVKLISVRDSLSRKHLLEQFNVVSVELLPDPALLSSILSKYDDFDAGSSVEPKVGIGVADIEGLNYSSDIVNSGELNCSELFVDIILAANRQGYSVELFTNGAIEDEHYLNETLIPILDSHNLNYLVAPKSNTPEQLVRVIKRYSLVAAYRLHANIIAHSLSIPTYAVSWDNKVSSFFDCIGFPDRAYADLKSLSSDFERILLDSKSGEEAFDTNKYEQLYYAFIGKSLEAS
tara:strand:+ start:12872 stop:14047 length:1176 start_codon:yes stop_codon:yes gene_type:complete